MQNTRSKLGIKNSSNLLQTDITKVSNLDSLDWESKDASTRYLTHSYHPYSAKYIPQIPRYLISNLTNRNDLILDNFVGSGTTLVESKILGRRAIGVDINPLACLVAKVKITNIQESDLKRISAVCISIREDILKLRASSEYNNTSTFNQGPELIYNNNHLMAKIPNPNILKWFNKNVIYELLTIKLKIDLLEETIQISEYLIMTLVILNSSKMIR